MTTKKKRKQKKRSWKRYVIATSSGEIYFQFKTKKEAIPFCRPQFGDEILKVTITED